MISLKTKTLKCLIESSVRNFATNPAVGYAGQTPQSYASLGQLISTQSELLHNRGIVHGDRVAILSENMPNWPAAYFAAVYSGAVAVPILPDFHASEIHHIIRHAGVKAIYVSKKLAEKIEDIRDSDISTIIILDDFSMASPESRLGKLKELFKEGGREYAKLKETAARAAGLIPQEVRESDLAAIIYTSGTTGHSKGVMLTHENIVSNVYSSAGVQPITETDRFLSILPLSHTYENTIGMLLPLMHGASIYYLDKPPVARVLLPAMSTVRPTLMLSVPLVLEKIYKAKIAPSLNRSGLAGKLLSLPWIRKQLCRIAGKKLMKSFGGKIKFFGLGGAPLAPDVETFLRAAGFPYAIGYGLTETSPLIAGTPPSLTKFQSTGPAIANVRIKLLDPDPESGEGEVLVRGPNVMKGYYKDPENTRKSFTSDGWFRTGDLGTIDEDGYLFIKGRLKNIILGPSGENIYPEALETHLNKWDYILESIVYAVHGKIVARVFLNYDILDQKYLKDNLTEPQAQEKIKALLEDTRQTVNSSVSVYSRIHKIYEQPEPFEKTPTQKIKRYLYTDAESM